MTQHKQSHRIKSHGRTSHHIALHQNRSHHHHGTAEGSFTAKTWFGHRAGRSPCAHSIGKFFLCYILLFSSETSAPGSPGNYLYEISAHGLQLLDWGSVALPQCKVNIVAEVMGADLALGLYERYVKYCRSCSLRPLLLDRIEGDIKPLINHLQFQSRFRRTDLTPVVDRFHRKRSRIAPLSSTEYRPREANFVADYLAGQGSSYLLQLQNSQAELPTTPCYLNIDPPYELLLQRHEALLVLTLGGSLSLPFNSYLDAPFVSSLALRMDRTIWCARNYVNLLLLLKLHSSYGC